VIFIPTCIPRRDKAFPCACPESEDRASSPGIAEVPLTQLMFSSPRTKKLAPTHVDIDLTESTATGRRGVPSRDEHRQAAKRVQRQILKDIPRPPNTS
jgi:hypothetical protein